MDGVLDASWPQALYACLVGSLGAPLFADLSEDDHAFAVGEARSKCDCFVVTSESIEDWMIIREGVAFGGFSLQAMRRRLRSEDRMRFDAHTGISEFRKLLDDSTSDKSESS